MVLRNLSMRTPLAVGFMLGMGCLLVNMLLVLAVMSGEGPLCEGKPSSVSLFSSPPLRLFFPSSHNQLPTPIFPH